ncbi:MAG: zinc ABC transporter substrate-binding protein [Bacteroidales bacterium]|jgi:zinc transport system substrate-binding protein|nr:zinc ABC transporter substrate-binding protein [Bacteroidales bacterium]
MLKYSVYTLLLVLLASCRQNAGGDGTPVITASIAPYKYFIEKIAGDDFRVNIMVPPGADPHIYEPYPGQISGLRKSQAYVSNGFMGFEMTWLDRFCEINSTMKLLSLNDGIVPVEPHHRHGGKTETADPHYWVSPDCARVMAKNLAAFLAALKPERREYYEANRAKLDSVISNIDSEARRLFANPPKRAFMIYHPNLGYLARYYNLEEIPVEYEGKEPPPARLKYLVDRARAEKLNTIFVQKEYDARNAEAIANEIGAEVVIIDPLSEDWESATRNMIEAVGKSLTENM